jgi:hypothetical protein
VHLLEENAELTLEKLGSRLWDYYWNSILIFLKKSYWRAIGKNASK